MYKDIIKADIHKFATSDFSADNNYGIPLKNKKRLRYMKAEANRPIIIHFVMNENVYILN